LKSVNQLLSADAEKATLWIELNAALKVADALFTNQFNGNEYLAGN